LQERSVQSDAQGKDSSQLRRAVQVKCACGNSFETRSTHKGDIHVEICSVSTRSITGNSAWWTRLAASERFRRKFAKSDGAQAAAAAK